ncbi:IMPACT family protein [Marinobacter zhanjiangensis]|uniref:YigZ family protein n=1 Tax=Marinobacter zhanjiangensis TaxID=578215 RepID=A0ABQ3B6Y3_9GAMM|nr:YigZ family protein [Marinobacter zhanjiangensis]GGY81294.1 hypothetical protein GCM10007071_30850 [Marinobacter zhanjiangensis]
MSQGYPIPAGFLEKETEVRKSRFIARVAPVHAREQVKALVQQAWQEHPDARHVCWAYQIGTPGSAAEAAMNDDGEPSGTAGKPILNVIQHKDMGDVAVIVIRYFGGIKLGAGGLVRAYAGAAESVLSAVEREVNQPMEQVVVTLPFALEQPLRHWCEQHEATPAETVYGEGVTMTVHLPEPAVDSLVSFCEANQLDYHYDTVTG